MLQWNATGDYDDLGGVSVLQAYVQDALGLIPREHRRQLDAIRVLDTDPRGVALGVYQQRGPSVWIELYLVPHLEDAAHAPPSARVWALRLSLAHTLFHEIGHHVTLHLNRRSEPSRKKNRVQQTLEKWAEEYVARRLQALVDAWLAPGGPASAPDARESLMTALHFYHKIGRIRLRAEPGTKRAASPSP